MRLADWLERLTVYTNVAAALGLIPASSDTLESKWAVDEAVLNKVLFLKATENCPHTNIFGNGVERRHFGVSFFVQLHTFVGVFFCRFILPSDCLSLQLIPLINKCL